MQNDRKTVSAYYGLHGLVVKKNLKTICSLSFQDNDIGRNAGLIEDGGQMVCVQQFTDKAHLVLDLFVFAPCPHKSWGYQVHQQTTLFQ